MYKFLFDKTVPGEDNISLIMAYKYYYGIISGGERMRSNTYLQYHGKEVLTSDLEKKVKDIWKAESCLYKAKLLRR